MRNPSLSLRFLLAYLFATVLIMTLLSFIARDLMIDFLKKRTELELQHYATFAAQEIQHEIDIRKTLLQRLASTREVSGFAQTYKSLPLVKVFTQYSEQLHDISYINSEGVEEVRVTGHAAISDVTLYSDDPNFQIARKDPGKVLVFDYPSEHAFVFMLAMKQYYGDKFLGCLKAVVPYEKLKGHLYDLSYSETGFVALLNSSGELQPISRLNNASRTFFDQLSRSAVVAKLEQEGVFLEESLEQKMFLASSRIEAQNLYAVSTMGYEEFLAGPDKIIQLFTAIMVILLAIGFVVFELINRYLTSPLKKLIAATEKMSHGQGSLLRIDSAPGEILALCDAFNDMVEKLSSSTISWEQMNNIFESMHESLIVVNIDGKIERVNTATSNLLGYDDDSLIGQSIEDVLVEENPQPGSWVMNVTRTKSQYAEREYRHRDGRKIPVVFSWTRLQNSQGMTQGLICLAHGLIDRCAQISSPQPPIVLKQ